MVQIAGSGSMLCLSAGGFLSSGVTGCTKLFLDFKHSFTGS